MLGRIYTCLFLKKFNNITILSQKCTQICNI